MISSSLPDTLTVEMDPLTHGLSGALLAKADLKRWGKTAFLALVIGALLPDIDHFPLRLMGGEFYLKYHRGLTHSFLGSIPLSLGLAFITKGLGRRLWEEGVPFPILFLLSLLGVYTHIFLDLITSFGTMLLYPFSKERFSLNLVFIIDPYVTLLFLIPLFFKKPHPARASLLLFSLYLLLATVNREHALKETRSKARLEGIKVERMEAYPAPFSPFNWMTISEGSDRYYILRMNILSSNNPGPFEIYRKGMDPYIQISMKDEAAKTYLWFAEFPLIRSKKVDGLWMVEYFDLRFYTYPPRRPFLLRLYMDRDGKVVRKEGTLELPIRW